MAKMQRVDLHLEHMTEQELMDVQQAVNTRLGELSQMTTAGTRADGEPAEPSRGTR